MIIKQYWYTSKRQPFPLWIGLFVYSVLTLKRCQDYNTIKSPIQNPSPESVPFFNCPCSDSAVSLLSKIQYIVYPKEKLVNNMPIRSYPMLGMDYGCLFSFIFSFPSLHLRLRGCQSNKNSKIK